MATKRNNNPRIEHGEGGEVILRFTNFTGSIVVKQDQTKKPAAATPSSSSTVKALGKRVHDNSHTKEQDHMKVDHDKENEPSEEEQKLTSPRPVKKEEGTSASASVSTSSSSSVRKNKKARKDASPANTLLMSPTPYRALGAPPQGRWGHSSTMIGKNRMVVYGGEGDGDQGASCTFGDLFVYESGANGTGGKWEKPINCDSIPRTWHSATFLADKHLLVVFGGERMDVTGVPEVLDEIQVCDVELFLWYPPAISGKAPSARSGHTASLVGKDIVIFGGSRGRSWQNNITVLDTERWHWKSLSIRNEPPPGRSYHSANVINEGKAVVYFGGNNGQKCFNGVHVLKVGAEGVSWEWFHPMVVGRAPAARTGHAACLLGDGKTILIQGGWDPQDETQPETKMFEDAFLLYTETWEWKEVSNIRELLIAPSTSTSASVSSSFPGMLVGHTAELARLPKQQKKKDEEAAGGGMVEKERQEVEEEEEEEVVMLFGGQDKAGVRREELYLLKM